MTAVSSSSSNGSSISCVTAHKRSWEVNNSASSRVSWGKFVRAQNLPPEQPGVSSPGVEYVENPKAPLPSAAELRDLDRACPGAADRILRLLEKQVAAEIALAKRREIFAFIRQVLAIVAGFILLSYRNYWGIFAFIMAFAEGVLAGKIRHAGANQKNIEEIMNAVGFEISPLDKSVNEEANGDLERKL